MSKRVVAIIQARMDSKRFPGKMKHLLGGFPLIDWVIRRLKQTQMTDEIILATSSRNTNDFLAERAEYLGIQYFRGDEENVLSRFAACAELTKAEIIVRVCADNPFIDPIEVDRVIRFYLDNKPDYAFNHIPDLGNNYIDGLGAEVFSKEILDTIIERASKPEHFEHVTLYIREHPDDFRIETFRAPAAYAYSDIVLDVNTKKDLERMQKYLDNISGNLSMVPEDIWVSELIPGIIKEK